MNNFRNLNRSEIKLAFFLFILMVLNPGLTQCYQQCRIEYNGSMNYFNSTSSLCQVVSICSSNETYNYLTNICSPITPNYNGFPNITTNSNSSLTNGQLSVPQINCVNGQFLPNSAICICYNGWTDSTNQTSSILNKCDTTIPGFSNQTGNSNGGLNTSSSSNDNSNNNSSSNSTVTQIITSSTSTGMPIFYVIIIITCSLICLCYVFCGLCIYCRYKKKNSKNDLKAKYLDGADNPFNIQHNNKFISNSHQIDQCVSTAKCKPLINQPVNNVYNQLEKLEPDYSHNYLCNGDAHLELNYADDTGRRSVRYHTPEKKKRNYKNSYSSIGKNQPRINKFYPNQMKDDDFFPTVSDIDSRYCHYRNVNDYTSKKVHGKTAKFSSVKKYPKKRSCSQDNSYNDYNREYSSISPTRIMFTETPDTVNKYKLPANQRVEKINRFKN